MALVAPSVTPAEVVRRQLSGKRFDGRSLVFQAVLLLSLLFSLLVLVVLLVDVLTQGTSVFAERGLDFLTSDISLRARAAGVGQAIRGSLWIAAFVAVVAFPVGVGAAVYLEEYAPDNRLTRFIDVNIRNLAGVPSVVYGILGLAIFVQALGVDRPGGGLTGGDTLLAGGLTLAILVLPIVVITSAEALRAVPDSIREAGFGVGATRWEVVRSHVLPYAAPGILTGTVLSIARALGEAAPLILVGAETGFFTRPGGGVVEELTSKFTALPMVVYTWAGQPGDDFRSLTAAAIVVMLSIVMLANAGAILLRNHYEKKR